MSVPAGALEDHVAAEFKAEYLHGETVDPEMTDWDVVEAERKLAIAKHNLKGSMRERTRLADDAPASKIALADELVAEDSLALADAEAGLRNAQMTARGVDLPPQLDEGLYDDAPIPERRLWHSLVTAAVVVRRGREWREPVADRVQTIARDDAPTTSAKLIEVAASLRW